MTGYEVWMLTDNVWHPVPNSRWPVRGYAERAADIWRKLNKTVEVREG